MKPFKNKKKEGFLASIPTCSLDEKGNDLAERCKFNFSYFDVQPAGQAFGDWTHPQLVDLLEKLRAYTKKPLSYWENQHAGAAGRVLSVYGGFPGKSEFEFPKHVPHQAKWSRFRLGNKVRLIGFVLPEARDGTLQKSTGVLYCCNTFYVVFLDLNHKFYSTEAS